MLEWDLAAVILSLSLLIANLIFGNINDKTLSEIKWSDTFILPLLTENNWEKKVYKRVYYVRSMPDVLFMNDQNLLVLIW